MGFGDSVKTLLETYSECLALLRVFGSHGDADSSRPSVVPSSVDWDRQSELTQSLRIDRARVQKAYTSRLSEAGSRLEKGDGRSRNALRRIVRRLADALAGLLGFGGSGSRNVTRDGLPLLNYDALRALSNASRVDAIHAIDELSVRLGSRGGRSRRSGSSKSSRSTGSRHASSDRGSSRPAPTRLLPELEKESPKQLAKTQHHRPAGGSNKTDRRSRGAGKKDSAKPTSSRNGSRNGSKGRPTRPLSAKKSLRKPMAKTDAANAPKKHSGSHSSINHASVSSTDTTMAGLLYEASRNPGRRVSLVSSSSASTRLGEIPERKLRRRYVPAQQRLTGNQQQEDLLDYNIRPAYPMRPLRTPEERKEQDETGKTKRGFWGRFRRA